MKFVPGAAFLVVLCLPGCVVSTKMAPSSEEPFALARKYTKLATMQAQDDDGDEYEITDSSVCRPGLTLLDDFAECRHAADGLALPFIAYEKTHSDSLGCSFKHAESASFVMFNQRPDDDDRDFSLVSVNASEDGQDSSEYSSRPVCTNRKFVTSFLADPPSAEQEAKSLKIFCFAWTTWRPEDVKLLPEVRRALQKCNDYRFFSDKYPSGFKDSDMTIVKVPEQQVSPTDKMFLYHKNMVGLMPAWDYILKSGIAANVDWVINLELDHLFIPSQTRLHIVQYLNRLRAGKKEWQASVDGSMMLMFGNTFLFNKKMVSQMKGQWSTLGKVAPKGHEAAGCPMFYEGRPEWPLHCSQDLIYPNMLIQMKPRVAGFGSPGCGQLPKDFPLACMEMPEISIPDPKNQTAIRSEIQSEVVRAVKAVQSMRSEDQLRQYLETNSPRLVSQASKIFAAKGTPLVHHLNDVAARKLANELFEL